MTREAINKLMMLGLIPAGTYSKESSEMMAPSNYVEDKRIQLMNLTNYGEWTTYVSDKVKETRFLEVV